MAQKLLVWYLHTIHLREKGHLEKGEKMATAIFLAGGGR